MPKLYPLAIKKHNNTVDTINKLQIRTKKLPTTNHNPDDNHIRPKEIVKQQQINRLELSAIEFLTFTSKLQPCRISSSSYP